jgi:hypothetical protein
MKSWFTLRFVEAYEAIKKSKQLAMCPAKEVPTDRDRGKRAQLYKYSTTSFSPWYDMTETMLVMTEAKLP